MSDNNNSKSDNDPKPQSSTPSKIDFRKEYDRLVSSVLDFNDKVEERIKELETKEAKWNKIQTALDDNIAKAKTKIKLDVGGKIFATSKSTLTALEGTYFYAMLGSGKWQPEADGSYFIDRNPKYFDRILDYLRTGNLEWSGLDQLARKKLKQDLDYFQIPIQEPTPAWDISMKGTNMVLTHDNTVASYSGNGWQSVLGENAVTSVTYRIDNRGAQGSFMIGLAPKPGFQPNTHNHSTCGYYLHGNGTLYSQSGDGGRAYLPAIQNGATVKVVYDKNSRTISFAVTEAEKAKKGTGNPSTFGTTSFGGVTVPPTWAFTNVNAELYPAMQSSDAGVCVSIIE